MAVQTIEVTNYIENDDGSATVVFDMDEDTVNSFIREGMRVALGDLSKDYVLVSSDEWDEWAKIANIPEPRTYELSSEEAQGFFQIGTLAAIKKGISETLGDE